MKVVVPEKVYSITKCYHRCPYFGTEGYIMVCNHPEAIDKGYILHHPEVDEGIPLKCPIRIKYGVEI